MLIVILLIAILVLAIRSFSSDEDDGLILDNVIAAGVNLGGMDADQAAAALESATGSTYTQLSMTVTVLDTTVTLSPTDTGASLDIAAVVEEAYNYGRTGSSSDQQNARKQAATQSHVVDILPYLNLDTDYIQSVVDDLGERYSSTLTPSSITLSGTAPSVNVTNPDTSVTYQTLTIFTGTAEYGLDTSELYEQIMDCYNSNIFFVVGNCTVVAPDSLDEQLQEIYNEVYVAPVDASIDETTYEVTAEVYGYGFDLDEVKSLIAAAPYGTTLEVSLHYIAPNVTADLLSGDLFQDTLGEVYAVYDTDSGWETNVTNACKLIDGLILKAGDEFSFNDAIGKLTTANGFTSATETNSGISSTFVGAGVCQVASVLYNCALKADLNILERTNHTYVTSFIEYGLDADVCSGDSDLRFRNNCTAPIRIDAEVVNGRIHISIMGTDTKDYVVEVVYEVAKTYSPTVLKTTMLTTNPGGYTDGQVLVSPITGYSINVYRCKYDKDNGRLLSKTLENQSRYQSRNAIVVSLQEPVVEATDPTETTDPSTETTVPDETTEPSETTEPEPSTDPEENGTGE